MHAFGSFLPFRRKQMAPPAHHDLHKPQLGAELDAALLVLHTLQLKVAGAVDAAGSTGTQEGHNQIS